MLAKKIMKNIENGNYRVEYREECDCDFYWYIDKYGKLDCETVRAHGTCYFNNVLIMDDLASQWDETIGVGSDGVIACYDTYFGVSLQVFCLNQGVEKEILKYIVNDAETYCQLVASINYPDAYNKKHERRKIDSLLEYLDCGILDWKGDKK